MGAILFIVRSLLWLVLLAFLLRVVLQFARADFRNPIAQAVVRVTNWLVLPLRRVVPPVGRVDLASIVALVLVQLVAVAIVLSLVGVSLTPYSRLLVFAAQSLAKLVLQFYIVSILIWVALSWIAPDTRSPASALLDRICEPPLAPFRRLIPPIGGFDLSPVFVLILLGALVQLLPPAVL
jgi:YggT family protein